MDSWNTLWLNECWGRKGLLLVCTFERRWRDRGTTEILSLSVSFGSKFMLCVIRTSKGETHDPLFQTQKRSRVFAVRLTVSLPVSLEVLSYPCLLLMLLFVSLFFNAFCFCIHALVTPTSSIRRSPCVAQTRHWRRPGEDPGGAGGHL